MSPEQQSRDRLQKLEGAATSFAQIGEELKARRQDVSEISDRERLEAMIHLNEQTAAIVRRSIAVNARYFEHEPRHSNHCTAPAVFGENR